MFVYILPLSACISCICYIIVYFYCIVVVDLVTDFFVAFQVDAVRCVAEVVIRRGIHLTKVAGLHRPTERFCGDFFLAVRVRKWVEMKEAKRGKPRVIFRENWRIVFGNAMKQKKLFSHYSAWSRLQLILVIIYSETACNCIICILANVSGVF